MAPEVNLLRPRRDSPVRRRGEPNSAVREEEKMPPKIDYGKCDGCGICIFVCGKTVFSLRPSDQKVLPKKAKECVNCFMCQDSCRIGAISIKG